MPGGSAYFVSDFPVVENGAVVLPAGMYVKGYIDHVQRLGEVKGRAQLQMRFGSIIFPNGVEIALPRSLDKVPGSRLQQGTSQELRRHCCARKQHGARCKADYWHNPRGSRSWQPGRRGNRKRRNGGRNRRRCQSGDSCSEPLLARGNDIVFPPGTTVEMVLNRPLVIQQAQLAGMPSYTGITAPVGLPQSPVITPTPLGRNHGAPTAATPRLLVGGCGSSSPLCEGCSSKSALRDGFAHGPI